MLGLEYLPGADDYDALCVNELLICIDTCVDISSRTGTREQGLHTGQS